MHCIKREKFKCKDLIVFSCKKIDLICSFVRLRHALASFLERVVQSSPGSNGGGRVLKVTVSFTYEWQIPELLQLLNHSSCDPGPLNQSLCETEIVSSESWRSMFSIDARFVGVGEYLAEILFENLKSEGAFLAKKENPIILTHTMYCWLLLQIHPRANLLGTPC